jgi:uncharacterized membrane protein required for colicin V production
VFAGLKSGLLRGLLGILFAIAAFLASAYLRYPLGAIASLFVKDIPPDYANLIGATVAFPLVLGILHAVSQRFLGRFQIQGITKGLDAALGAVLGGVEAILILSAAIVILDAYFGTSKLPSPLAPSGSLKELAKAFNASETVHLLRESTVPAVLAVLGPLLPRDVRSLLPTGLPGVAPSGNSMPTS